MNRNTSISLGTHFDKFVQGSINAGRFNNTSEVIRAGLRLLEEEENKLIVLKNAINEGVESGISKDFDPDKQLKKLKSRRNG